MKILIAAGGTGGHLYPGIVLAREFKKRGAEVFFIVRKRKNEEKILQSEKIPYFQLNFEGLPRRIRLPLFLYFPKLFFAAFKVVILLKSLRPYLVVGMGGYLSFPVILAAKLYSLPTIIHEQNLYPGLANRLLARIVDKIAISFPETIRFFPAKKTVYAGNPVREELKGISRELAKEKFGFSEDKFTILIFGGSAGARHINEVVVNALSLLSGLRKKVQFLHLSGEKDYPWVEENYRKQNFPGKVLPYLEEMGFAYACADLVISRAGASTIAEILYLKKPSLLIPYPYATGKHQELQARYLSEKGYAYFSLDKDFTPDFFARFIEDCFIHPEKLKTLSTCLEKFNPPQAVNKLSNLILS